MADSPHSETAVSAMRPLRVCHLAYSFYETDNRVQRYAKALVERGDEVDVIALRRPRQPRTEEEGGVRVIRLQRRTKTEGPPLGYLVKILWFMIQSLAVLSVRHLSRRYDVVHVHNVPDFLVFAALLPKAMGARIILDIHDILPELYAGKFGPSRGSVVFGCLLVAERLSCRFADFVIVANHLWHDRLVERSAPARKCGTIMNYPDLRLFRPRGSETRQDGKFIILYPGSLSRHQGLSVAIRAFAAVADEMRDAEFHIYGEGPARADLVQLTRECRLVGRVRIMDPVPVDRIADVIASANIGVEPKLAKGFSNEALSTKILEFLASGVPVLVSRTQVHAHYFDDTIVTFFASEDERELAAALVSAYARPPDHDRIQRGRELAARYSWQHRVADYYELLGSLTAANHRREAAVG